MLLGHDSRELARASRSLLHQPTHVCDAVSRKLMMRLVSVAGVSVSLHNHSGISTPNGRILSPVWRALLAIKPVSEQLEQRKRISRREVLVKRPALKRLQQAFFATCAIHRVPGRLRLWWCCNGNTAALALATHFEHNDERKRIEI